MKEIWNLTTGCNPPPHTPQQNRRNLKLSERPIFTAILRFAAEYRVFCPSQLLARFPQAIKSLRTAQRHIRDLTDDGLLERRRPQQNWPWIYNLTQRGATALASAYNQRGIDINAADLRCRIRADAGLLHEVLLTNLQLTLHIGARQQSHLTIPVFNRKYVSHPLAYHAGGKTKHLIPDLGFLLQVAVAEGNPRLIFSFVELDRATEPLQKLIHKLRAYELWQQSQHAGEYLNAIYTQYGSGNPQPVFRLIIVAVSGAAEGDRRRLTDFILAALTISPALRNSIWIATAEGIQQFQENPQARVWIKAADSEQWRQQFDAIGTTNEPGELQKRRRQFVHDRIAGMPCHSLFPANPKPRSSR